MNPGPDLLHHRPGGSDPAGQPLTSRAMSDYKSEFLHELSSRGFIHQVSEPDVLDEFARNKVVTAYIGFDCTAPSLHIGSLLPIMMLHWMQHTGHRPIGARM